jgi:hypothetical protein
VLDIKSLSLSLQLLFSTFFTPTATHPITLEMSSEEQKGVRAKRQLFLCECNYSMSVLTKVSDDPQYTVWLKTFLLFSSCHKRTDRQTNMAGQPLPLLPLHSFSSRDPRRYVRSFSSIIEKFWRLQGQFWWLGTGTDPEGSYSSSRHPPPLPHISHATPQKVYKLP